MGAARPSRVTAAGLALLIGTIAASVDLTPAAAQTDFYKNKTITIVVGYSPGGGYDQYARLLARRFGAHVPGNPTVLVQNLPGAASLTAVRYLDATAPKDGTVITTFDPGLVTQSVASPELLRINLSDFRWIGTMLRDIRICYAWSATGIRTWNDMMQRREFLVGSTAKGSNAYVDGAILRKVFNAPVRQISGYPGSNEQRLALERGELEGNCASWSAMPQDWLARDLVSPLVRFSPRRPPDMSESVPFIEDLATTREQKDLLAVLDAPTELGRPLIVAKQVPAERVKVLRHALEATLRDPAFLAEAQAQSLPLDPVPGEEAEAIVNRIYSASTDIARKVKDVLD
jgi:tripartite-type tricarboxylate transporter receptor subunit TctC